MNAVAVEDGEERIFGLAEDDPVTASGRDPAAARAAAETLGKRDRPLRAPRHRAEGDRLHRTGQPQATAPAAHRVHEPGAAELPHHSVQVAAGYAVLVRDLPDDGEALAIGHEGQLYQ